MSDIAQIAAALVAFVAPFTPALLEAGKAAGQQWAETLAAKAGEATWNKAQALWEKIHARFGDDPKVKGAALLVSADPEDSDAQTLLATALGKQLQADLQFTQELVHLIRVLGHCEGVNINNENGFPKGAVWPDSTWSPPRRLAVVVCQGSTLWRSFWRRGESAQRTRRRPTPPSRRSNRAGSAIQG